MVYKAIFQLFPLPINKGNNCEWPLCTTRTKDTGIKHYKATHSAIAASKHFWKKKCKEKNISVKQLAKNNYSCFLALFSDILSKKCSLSENEKHTSLILSPAEIAYLCFRIYTALAIAFLGVLPLAWIWPLHSFLLSIALAQGAVYRSFWSKNSHAFMCMQAKCGTTNWRRKFGEQNGGERIAIQLNPWKIGPRQLKGRLTLTKFVLLLWEFDTSINEKWAMPPKKCYVHWLGSLILPIIWSTFSKK